MAEMEKTPSTLLIFEDKLEKGLAAQGIFLPIEVQDKILTFKVIAERREEMKRVYAELKELKVCSKFGWVKQPCSERRWNPILESIDHKWLVSECFFCHKFVNERLIMDMQVYGRKELPPPDPMDPENPTLLRTWKNPDYRSIILNRFYEACGNYALRWHRHFSRLSFTEKLHQVNVVGARPLWMDSLDKVWQFAENCLRVVQIMLAVEVSDYAFMEDHIRDLEEAYPEED